MIGEWIIDRDGMGMPRHLFYNVIFFSTHKFASRFAQGGMSSYWYCTLAWIEK